MLFPGKVIELKIVDGGEVKLVRFLANDDEELVKALLSVKQRRNGSEKESAADKNLSDLHQVETSSAFQRISTMVNAAFDSGKKENKNMGDLDLPDFLKKIETDALNKKLAELGDKSKTSEPSRKVLKGNKGGKDV